VDDYTVGNVKRSNQGPFDSKPTIGTAACRSCEISNVGKRREFMKQKFLGDLEKLKKCVSRTGVPGQWREIKNQQMQYRTNDGAFLNWWESSGTVSFQGKEEEAIRKLSEPFVRVALGRGLLEGERDADEEIADPKRPLKDVLIEIAKLKRRQKHMRMEIAELKDAVARI
jgi:hypothetical protein